MAQFSEQDATNAIGGLGEIAKGIGLVIDNAGRVFDVVTGKPVVDQAAAQRALQKAKVKAAALAKAKASAEAAARCQAAQVRKARGEAALPGDDTACAGLASSSSSAGLAKTALTVLGVVAAAKFLG